MSIPSNHPRIPLARHCRRCAPLVLFWVGVVSLLWAASARAQAAAPPIRVFPRPATLEEVARLPDREIDPAWVALLAEAPLFPDADRELLIGKVDDLARRLSRLPATEKSLTRRVEQAAQMLFYDADFRVPPADDRADSRGHIAHKVLTAKTGSALGLSILFVSVCRRAGIDARLGVTPDHTFASVDDGRFGVVVDGTQEGRVFGRIQFVRRSRLAGELPVWNLSGIRIIGLCLQNAAVQAASSGNAQLADRLRERARAIDPDNPAALYSRARALCGERKYAEALELIVRARAERPTWARFTLEHATVLYRLGKREQADAVVDQLFGLEIARAQVWNWTAWTLANCAAYRRSERAAARALELDPGNTYALSIVARTALECKQAGRALDACDDYFAQVRRLRENGPKKRLPEKARIVTMHQLRAEALIALRRWHDAILALDRAIELDDTGVESRLMKAQIYIDRKILGPARRHAEEVLERDPDHAEAHFILGKALYSQRAFDAAVVQLQRSIELDPDHWERWRWLLWVLDYRDRTPEALAVARKICAKWPAWPWAWFEVGNHEAQLAGLARPDFDSWLAGFGRFPASSNAAARPATTARALAYLTRVRAALEAFGKALALDPTHKQARDAKVRFCRTHGFSKTAAACLEEAREPEKREPARAGPAKERAATSEPPRLPDAKK